MNKEIIILLVVVALVAFYYYQTQGKSKLLTHEAETQTTEETENRFTIISRLKEEHRAEIQKLEEQLDTRDKLIGNQRKLINVRYPSSKSIEEQHDNVLQGKLEAQLKKTNQEQLDDLLARKDEHYQKLLKDKEKKLGEELNEVQQKAKQDLENQFNRQRGLIDGLKRQVDLNFECVNKLALVINGEKYKDPEKINVMTLKFDLENKLANAHSLEKSNSSLQEMLKEIRNQLWTEGGKLRGLQKEHQEQLRKINLLFDDKAGSYETIDFNGLYSLLLANSREREREREREPTTEPGKK